jgi:hypothetical protein
MNTIKKLAANVTLVTVLFGLSGCIAIGIGVGAVAGSGTGVGVLGGAVIGGVVGYEVSK